MLAACGGRQVRDGDEAVLTLTNGTEGAVTGALLRFDREITRVDPLSEEGFARRQLRLSPADTLRLEEGRLAPGESVRYRLKGAGGAPRLAEGRWIVGGRLGDVIEDDEARLN